MKLKMFEALVKKQMAPWLMRSAVFSLFLSTTVFAVATSVTVNQPDAFGQIGTNTKGVTIGNAGGSGSTFAAPLFVFSPGGAQLFTGNFAQKPNSAADITFQGALSSDGTAPVKASGFTPLKFSISYTTDAFYGTTYTFTPANFPALGDSLCGNAGSQPYTTAGSTNCEFAIAFLTGVTGTPAPHISDFSVVDGTNASIDFYGTVTGATWMPNAAGNVVCLFAKDITSSPTAAWFDNSGFDGSDYFNVAWLDDDWGDAAVACLKDNTGDTTSFSTWDNISVTN